MTHFHSKLRPDGTLFIAVPNCNSFDAQHYKEFWAAYDLPRHLYHFTPTTINHLFHSTGFELISTHPMWFDSFYVSLLSARYKNRKPSMLSMLIGTLSAIAIGGISNLYTIIDKKRCSSLIYILKKR